VKGTPYDFTASRRLGDGAPFDDFFLLRPDRDGPAAELYSPASGRVMRVYTDMPALVLYTPNKEGRPGKDGAWYTGFCAVCLETQYVPNAVNCPGFDAPLFYRGEKLRSRTVYEFGVR